MDDGNFYPSTPHPIVVEITCITKPSPSVIRLTKFGNERSSVGCFPQPHRYQSSASQAAPMPFLIVAALSVFWRLTVIVRVSGTVSWSSSASQHRRFPHHPISLLELALAGSLSVCVRNAVAIAFCVTGLPIAVNIQSAWSALLSADSYPHIGNTVPSVVRVADIAKGIARCWLGRINVR